MKSDPGMEFDNVVAVNISQINSTDDHEQVLETTKKYLQHQWWLIPESVTSLQILHHNQFRCFESMFRHIVLSHPMIQIVLKVTLTTPALLNPTHLSTF